MTALGQAFPSRINHHVPNMRYAADVRDRGYARVSIAALPVADPDGILDGESIASAGSTTTFEAGYSDDVMGQFGRNVTVVADGAATSTVTVHGRDYLGQPMSETLALNGANAVTGVKAFAQVDSVEWAGTASRSIDLGWGTSIGLPYRSVKMDTELVDGAVPANAGALTAGAANSTTQTATTADPRGLYVPHSNSAPDGSKTYELFLACDDQNLHGNAHFYSG